MFAEMLDQLATSCSTGDFGFGVVVGVVLASTLFIVAASWRT